MNKLLIAIVLLGAPSWAWSAADSARCRTEIAGEEFDFTTDYIADDYPRVVTTVVDSTGEMHTYKSATNHSYAVMTGGDVRRSDELSNWARTAGVELSKIERATQFVVFHWLEKGELRGISLLKFTGPSSTELATVLIEREPEVTVHLCH